MKKLFSVLLVVLLLCMLPVSAFAAGNASYDWKVEAKSIGISGDGTERNPYCISTDHQLTAFLSRAEDEDFERVCFKLTDDIKGISKYDGLRRTAFTQTPFEGSFNGNGHSIEIETLNTYCLFPAIGEEGTVKNLIVTGTFVSDTEKARIPFGSICSENHGEIMNCTSNCIIEKGGAGEGGICGINYGKIVNSLNKSSIDNAFETGGICAENYGTIVNCVSYGEISDSQTGGGICGINEGTVENCYFINAPDNGFGTMLTEQQFNPQYSEFYHDLNILIHDYRGSNEWVPWIWDDMGYPQLNYSKIVPYASIFSVGHPWSVVALAGVVIAATVVFIVVRKKVKTVKS